MSPKNVVLVLHNIRSIHNVGAIFRTAECAGVSEIILSGYTPSPIDRFGRTRPDFAKTSLGADENVSWKSISRILPYILKSKQSGYQIVSIEQAPHSIDYKKVTPQYPFMLIVGNEVRGLSSSILKASDMIAEIPMKGAMVRQAHHPRRTGVGKESLNVSVALGIALFRIIDL